MHAASNLSSKLSEGQARDLFNSVVPPGDYIMDFHDFLRVCDMTALDDVVKLPPSHRDMNGNIQLKASGERYFGKALRKLNAGRNGNSMDFMVARSQEFAMELYESRIASLQRFVSMAVLFHQMGWRVESFFRRWSLGVLGYRMDRTHSIVRIATTASPISGADVNNQMKKLQLYRAVRKSVQVISTAYLNYKARISCQKMNNVDTASKLDDATVKSSASDLIDI